MPAEQHVLTSGCWQRWLLQNTGNGQNGHVNLMSAQLVLACGLNVPHTQVQMSHTHKSRCPTHQPTCPTHTQVQMSHTHKSRCPTHTSPDVPRTQVQMSHTQAQMSHTQAQMSHTFNLARHAEYCSGTAVGHTGHQSL